jgi:hypothetical protein
MTTETTTETITTAVGVDSVPTPIQRLSTLARIDYVDSYRATTTRARERSPEQWARVVLEDTAVGRQARRVWQLLGLRMGPRNSPDYVQGWRIAARGDDWIRAETNSWWASAQVVCRVESTHLSLSVFLRYDHPLGRLIWAPVSVMHRRAVPVLLRQGLTS